MNHGIPNPYPRLHTLHSNQKVTEAAAYMAIEVAGIMQPACVKVLPSASQLMKDRQNKA